MRRNPYESDFMKCQTISILALAILLPNFNPVQAAKKGEKGWKSIFSGKDIQGWEMVGPGQLKLENGELVTEGGMGMLWYSEKKYGNCQIRVVFKLTGPKDNSGVFIRMPEKPKTPMQAVNQGYEVQIENNGDEWHRTGCL